jgi:hypothetical protein
VNGTRLAELRVEKGYAVLQRQWKSGDEVQLDLPMQVEAVLANQRVADDRGRVAFERGPLVYCFEAIDNAGSVQDLVVSADTAFTPERRDDLLSGITVLTAAAQRASRQPDGSVTLAPAQVTAIPYYAWAHRQMGEMAVWLPSDVQRARVRPLPTIASTSRPSASHVWSLDAVEALNDQLEPADSGDHDIPRHTWWDHRGTREWVQYDFANPRTVSAVQVYWFDDTGRGQCRIPTSWQILYRDGDRWRPVENRDEYAVAKDRFNRVSFTPVETQALRLEVNLQDQFSAGVLEWRVE